MDQGLPISFDNTAATWQNMPMFAAMQTGQQNRIAQENISALQRAFAEEQAFKAQQRPVELDNLVKSGKLTAAQANHFDALSRAANFTADKQAGTLASDIAAGNSKNATAQVTDQATQGEAKGLMEGQVAAYLKGEGSYLQPAQKARYITQKLGLDPAMEPQLIRDMNKVIPMLEAHAKAVYENSATARGITTKEAGDTERQKIAAKATTDAAAIHAQAVRDAAEMSARAKEKNKADFEAMLAKADPLKRYTMLKDAVIRATQAGDLAAAADFAQRANDPALVKAAKAVASAGGTATVGVGANGRAGLLPRQEAVDLGEGDLLKPKPGTAENPIKLD